MAGIFGLTGVVVIVEMRLLYFMGATAHAIILPPHYIITFVFIIAPVRACHFCLTSGAFLLVTKNFSISSAKNTVTILERE